MRAKSTPVGRNERLEDTRLFVDVDHQDLGPQLGKRRAEVHDGGRLADATFLVCDGDGSWGRGEPVEPELGEGHDVGLHGSTDSIWQIAKRLLCL